MDLIGGDKNTIESDLGPYKDDVVVKNGKIEHHVGSSIKSPKSTGVALSRDILNNFDEKITKQNLDINNLQITNEEIQNK